MLHQRRPTVNVSPEANRRSMPQSLQCPQCEGIVSINDRDAGTRVTCPHCQSTFIAPGAQVVAGDDDDWLRLDDDASPVLDVTEAGINEVDEVEVVDEMETGEAIDGSHDAEDFFSSEDVPPPPAQLDDPFGDLPPMEIPSMAPPPPRPKVNDLADDLLPELGPPTKRTTSDSGQTPVASSTEFQSEFRLNCRVCGTMHYAKASQEGTTIKCTDCHSGILVPAPPRVKQAAQIDIQNAQTFEFEEPATDARREDPFRRSAEDLLADAERAGPDVKPDDFETPSILEWGRKVFGIFTDLNVMLRWIMFTLIGSVPLYLALAFENKIAALGVIIGGALFGAMLLSCGFSILQSVANDERTVEDWPSWDPMEWLGNAWVAFAAAGFAGVPALILSQMVFENPLLVIGVTMFSIYMIFPFVLLSMLDMQTVMMPFSPEVARSVSSSQESWGGFYFSAGLLFFGVFLLFVATAGMPPGVAAVTSVAAIVALVFTYFAMIGRLAYAIGQAVNEKPRESGIEDERTKSTEA